MRLRLLGINAPEIKGETIPQGKASRDWLHKLLVGNSFYVRSYLDQADKYGGRWDAEIFAPIVLMNPADPKTATIPRSTVEDLAVMPLTNVNQLLIQCGFAVAYSV